MFPEPQYEPDELPLEHEIFRCVYRLKEKPQVPSIHTWRGARASPGRITATRLRNRPLHGYQGRQRPADGDHLPQHRSGDGWEREGENEDYFHEFSEKKSYPDGYQYRDLCHDPLTDTPVSHPPSRPPEVDV